MSILAKFMAMLFGAAFSFFGRFFVAEKAARLAAWTVLFAVMSALISSAFSCISGVCASNIAAMASFHSSIGMGLGIAWNQVTLSAVSCYMTVWIACQLYVIKKKAINLIIGGS
jgi:hypothetical protein